MPTIIDVRFAHEDGALADTLDRLPELEARVVRETSTDPDTRRYYLRVRNADRGQIQAALTADHTVLDATALPEFDDGQLWNVAFDPETKLLAPRVTANGGLVIDARSSRGDGEPRGWRERWLLPDSDAVTDIWTCAREADFAFELLDVHRDSDGDGAASLARTALTEDQQQALETAFDRGYFLEPRETSLEELGEEIDLSASAIGGRLKRGMKSLVGATLVVDRPGTGAAAPDGQLPRATIGPADRQASTSVDRSTGGAQSLSSAVVDGRSRRSLQTPDISLVVYVEHPDLALSPTIRALPSVDIGVVSDAGTDPDHDVYYFWVVAEDYETVERFLDGDHTVASYERVIETEARWIYGIEYTDAAALITPAITDMGVIVEESRSHGNGWRLTLQLQDHEVLDRFKDYVERTSFQYEVFELHRDGSTEDDAGLGLTAAQIEALVCAHEHGYYDEPRRVSLEELGSILGVSQTAVSGRLRRGSARLLAEVFEG